jgi:D-beta-D-heptose 7-phosphate kinase/D-beta-D-heptose 1-phosphate adenosyltransferase
MSQTLAAQKDVKQFAQQVKERKVRIAVVGDIILDNAIEAEHQGTHPEFKIPILRDATTQESIGGAGNIALALARLGADVSLFGIIGSDLPGRQLENLLDRQQFPHFLITERGWPTPRKDWLYQREAGQVKLTKRIDYDRPVRPQAREELVAEFRVRSPAKVDVVLLADHGIGSIGPESLALVGLAKERGAKIVAIPRSTVLRGHPVDAIVLNSTEMRHLANASDGADARQLAARYAREQKRLVCLTLFEEGMDLCPADGSPLHLPCYPLERADWLGVRDITAAILAMGLGLQMPLSSLGQVAMVFRHLVSAQRGNGRVTWPEVFHFLGMEENVAMS